MYQVGSMVEANGKLYTISYGPTICEFDGENWRIAVVASSFSDVLRFSEDGSFYSDETSAVLSVDEDGTLLLLYPYSDGVIDLLRIPLDGSGVTRVHSFRLVEDSGDEDGSLYFSLQGAALTSDYAYVTAYGLNPEAMYGLNQLFELNLKDGSVRKVTEDYIGIILPLDDTSLIGYYDNRYTGADDPLTALVRINRQTGLTDTLCEMESDSSFSWLHHVRHVRRLQRWLCRCCASPRRMTPWRRLATCPRRMCTPICPAACPAIPTILTTTTPV